VRFRRVAGKVLLSNPWGDWIALTGAEFEAVSQ
jgi:hypothetical protein